MKIVKIALPIFLLQCLIICLAGNAINAQENNKTFRILKKNADLLDSISQLLVVFNDAPDSDSATLLAMEKKNRKWIIVSAPLSAGIGRKGFAAPNKKREGDKKTPTGFFRLGQLFCYEDEVNTRMPFIQATSEDKWIDDPDSDDYNRHVRGATQANSYENLLLNGNDYRYCMVIEYNTNPVIKGNGSAIFLHLSEGDSVNPSSGCVVLSQKDMEQLLKWMDPELKPSILMGNEKVLRRGLRRE